MEAVHAVLTKSLIKNRRLPAVAVDGLCEPVRAVDRHPTNLRRAALRPAVFVPGLAEPDGAVQPDGVEPAGRDQRDNVQNLRYADADGGTFFLDPSSTNHYLV